MNNLDFNFFCGKCSRSREYREANCFARHRIRRFKKGEYIVYKGDAVRELSMLVEGSITVSFPLSSGLVIRTVVHHAPYPIGALALFAHENCYRVDVVANEDVVVISVRKEDIERQIVECRDFMRSFIAYPVSKLDIFTEHLAVVTHKSIKAKLAYYIVLCSSGRSYRFDRSVSKLASYLAVERPSLSRVIAQMVDEGLISYDGGEGEILDFAEMKRLVE